MVLDYIAGDSSSRLGEHVTNLGYPGKRLGSRYVAFPIYILCTYDCHGSAQYPPVIKDQIWFAGKSTISFDDFQETIPLVTFRQRISQLAMFEDTVAGCCGYCKSSKIRCPFISVPRSSSSTSPVSVHLGVTISTGCNVV